MKLHGALLAAHQLNKKCIKFGLNSSVKAAEQSSELVADEKIIPEEPAKIKRDLYAALQGKFNLIPFQMGFLYWIQLKSYDMWRIWTCIVGINRGIFGVTSAKKTEILKLVELLESQNPNPEPTSCLEKVEQILNGVVKL